MYDSAASFSAKEGSPRRQTSPRHLSFIPSAMAIEASGRQWGDDKKVQDLILEPECVESLDRFTRTFTVSRMWTFALADKCLTFSSGFVRQGEKESCLLRTTSFSKALSPHVQPLTRI